MKKYVKRDLNTCQESYGGIPYARSTTACYYMFLVYTIVLIHMCIHVYLYVQILVNTHTYIHVYAYVHPHTYTHNMYVHMYAHTHIHKHTHKHTLTKITHIRTKHILIFKPNSHCIFDFEKLTRFNKGLDSDRRHFFFF